MSPFGLCIVGEYRLRTWRSSPAYKKYVERTNYLEAENTREILLIKVKKWEFLIN
jgi:hypothetical protein